MLLKIQTRNDGDWVYQVKRRFNCRSKKLPYDGTEFDYDASFFEEDNLKGWKEHNELTVFLIIFFDEELNEVSMITDLSVDIYLLNDEGKTIDVINHIN